MDKQKLDKLKIKYGKLCSWAVWDENDIGNIKIIEDRAEELHSKYIIVGLNISQELFSDWSNFHVNKRGNHHRKLRLAFNSHEKVRGAYMTDMLKKVEKDSGQIRKYILNSANKIEINKQKIDFQNELIEVGATAQSIFILLGGIVHEYFHEFTNEKYNSCIYLKHYSAHGITDEGWKDKALEEINKS